MPILIKCVPPTMVSLQYLELVGRKRRKVSGSRRYSGIYSFLCREVHGPIFKIVPPSRREIFVETAVILSPPPPRCSQK